MLFDCGSRGGRGHPKAFDWPHADGSRRSKLGGAVQAGSDCRGQPGGRRWGRGSPRLAAPFFRERARSPPRGARLPPGTQRAPVRGAALYPTRSFRHAFFRTSTPPRRWARALGGQHRQRAYGRLFPPDLKIFKKKPQLYASLSIHFTLYLVIFPFGKKLEGLIFFICGLNLRASALKKPSVCFGKSINLHLVDCRVCAKSVIFIIFSRKNVRENGFSVPPTFFEKLRLYYKNTKRRNF